MDRAAVVDLFDYMYWANYRLLDAAGRLTRDRFVAGSTATTRDLRATLVHELDVEWSWRESLRGEPVETWGADAELQALDYPAVDALRDHWRRDEAEMRAWLGGLSEEDLAAEVTPGLAGRALPLWRYLLHVVFHATQQQADAATLLTQAGASPGDIGYLEYVASTAAEGTGRSVTGD